MRAAMQQKRTDDAPIDIENKENKENADVQKSPIVDRKIKPTAAEVKTEPELDDIPLPTTRTSEFDDIPLKSNKPKMGGETPSWEEYMKQIQEEEAKNPTPVTESKPVAKKTAAKKAEPKAVDPEEEEKKKKRYQKFHSNDFSYIFYRQEEADKRRAEMRAAMQKKPADEPKKEEEPQPVSEPVKEEVPIRTSEFDDIPLRSNKTKSNMGSGEMPSWEEYMKQIQEDDAKNPTPAPGNSIEVYVRSYIYISC